MKLGISLKGWFEDNLFKVLRKKPPQNLQQKIHSRNRPACMWERRKTPPWSLVQFGKIISYKPR